jgi:uncharacterized protein with von Willebrand factor type A (vWA) domain
MDRRARTSFHSSSAAVPRTLTSPPNDNAGRLQILDMNPRGHDKVEMKIVMDLAEYFPGRGTFSAALDAALECLRHAKYKKSDIVFIMNGENQVSAECAEKFRRKKDKFGFSLYSILIDVGQVRSAL